MDISYGAPRLVSPDDYIWADSFATGLVRCGECEEPHKMMYLELGGEYKDKRGTTKFLFDIEALSSMISQLQNIIDNQDKLDIKWPET